MDQKRKRNSVLEILRLCASLWVMYYHGLSLITRTDAFSNGRIAVDFFFLLSGFFFLGSYKKENDKTLFKGLCSFIWKRFKPLAITFSICMLFSIIYYIQFYDGFFNSSIFGYLWYVPHLLVVLAIYYLLRRLIKNDKWFYLITILLSITCYTLILTYLTNFGLIRGIAGIGLGILISRIPKLTIKNSNIIAITTTCIIFIIITSIAYIYPSEYIEDPLCLLFLFPLIINFASNINFSNTIINKICSISFGLYAYQTVTRLLEENNIITIGWQMFLIVLVLSIIDIIVKTIIKQNINLSNN